MNERSIAYSHVQNQHPSSWIDDPFQLGTYAVKGVTNINHKKNLSDYAEELAYNYGKYEVDHYELILEKLSDYDQNELARLYIEATGREVTECVNGNDFSIDNEYTCALLAMLNGFCKETRDKFAEVTRKNIITYYHDSLQKILDEACQDLLCNLNDNKDQDREEGQAYWGKLI